MDAQGAPIMEFVRAGRVGGGIASAVGYRAAGLPETLHRGLPSPYLTFIFSLDGPVVGADDPAAVRGAGGFGCDVLVAGLHPRPTYVVQPERQSGVQLAVHPLAARALFGVRAADLGTGAVEAADLIGPGVTDVWERLREAPSWDAAFAVVDGFLRERSGARPPRDELAEAWRWLAWHRGRGSVDGLARHVGLSARQLSTLFRRELGLGPKGVSRLMRFDAARQAIAAAVAAGREPALAGVAHRHGYCDQAHLAREFREFAGLAPSAWISEERRNIQAGGHRRGEDSEV
ncbi:helix-turn-helix domain-containing protein [Actinomadura flavalba]|uniref:helix-turn-helix domain-containing protein n=1 Tax=Actinomadura flavalba TaxID=1120938 RepID=UPI00035D55EC|nr:AraC family transcriptional regulator [Actinomadura flavalba]